MKKTISLLLALVMCLSLCSCGDKDQTADTTDETPTQSDTTVATEQSEAVPEETVMTKEEMLEVASELDLEELQKLANNHIVKAESEYCNKILKYYGQITEIAKDHITFGSGGYCQLDVYLPIEDILLLENGQFVTIVGQTSDTIEGESDEWGVMNYCCSMNVAYVSSDRVEVTGTIFKERSAKSGYLFFISGTNQGRGIYFADGVEVEPYIEKEVKISARCVDTSYYDTTILEIVE